MSNKHFTISGRIVCRHNLFVDVVKTLARNEFLQIRTVEYSYHAGVIGAMARSTFRYDNAHAYDGHADEHHIHRFDVTTWKPIEPPIWVGREGWPHLNEVIEELRDWWQTTGAYLDLGAG